MVEVLNHCYLIHVGDAVPHGIETLQERVKGLVTLALDECEVLGLHQFIREHWKFMTNQLQKSFQWSMQW
jgi:hypothetical protein